MSNRKFYLIPFFLFILSILLRISLISKGPFHSDTLFMAVKAQEILETGKIQYLQGSGLPLSAILGAFFLFLTKIFNNHDPVFAVNLMSVVLSSLCVLMAYHIIRELFNRETALVGALLLAFNSSFLAISVFGTSHNPANLFLLLGIYYLIKFHKSGARHLLFLSGLNFGFMGASRLQDLLMMVVPICFLFFAGLDDCLTDNSYKRDNKFLIKNFGPFILFITFSCLIFYIPLFIRFPHDILADKIQTILKSQAFDTYMGIISPKLLKSISFMAHSFSWPGLLFALAGLSILARKSARLTGFLALWFLVPFLVYGNIDFVNPRYLVLSYIPLTITEGYFLSIFLKKENWVRALTFFVLFAVLAIPFIRIYPIINFRHKHELLPEFSRWVGEKTEPNAVIIERDDNLFHNYYGHRKTLSPHIGLYYMDKHKFKLFTQKIDNLLQKEVPVYITGTCLWGHGPKINFYETMKEHYALNFIGAHLLEDWHTGCLNSLVGYIHLYRLEEIDK